MRWVVFERANFVIESSGVNETNVVLDDSTMLSKPPKFQVFADVKDDK